MSAVHPGEYEQVGAAYHSRGHDLDTAIGELHRAWRSGHGATRGDTSSSDPTARYLQLPAPRPVPGLGGWLLRGRPPPGRPSGRRLDAAVPRRRPVRRRRRAPRQGGRRRRAGLRSRSPRPWCLFVSIDDDRDRGAAKRHAVDGLPLRNPAQGLRTPTGHRHGRRGGGPGRRVPAGSVRNTWPST